MKTWQRLKENPALFQRYFVKEYTFKAVRKFFEHRNYHEMESPILAPALPQERYLEVLDTVIELSGNRKRTAYVLPTTERYNKIGLAAGLGEHFVITKVARGLEDIGPNHSPEFTMLEWYHLNANYFDLMSDTEELVIFIKKFLELALNAKKEDLNKIFSLSFDEINSHECDLTINYLGQKIDLSKGWNRLSIPDALEKFSNVKLENIQTEEQIREFCKAKGYRIGDDYDWQNCFEILFAQEIEANLDQTRPTFIYNYPKILCPLTKQNAENPLVCEKVELYIVGKEMANGYTELIDGDEQEKRFKIEQEARKELGKKPVTFDHELVEAIKSGMPDVAGIGMGLDRLIMLFAGAKYISEINLFPASEWFEE